MTEKCIIYVHMHDLSMWHTYLILSTSIIVPCDDNIIQYIISGDKKYEDDSWGH